MYIRAVPDLLSPTQNVSRPGLLLNMLIPRLFHQIAKVLFALFGWASGGVGRKKGGGGGTLR